MNNDIIDYKEVMERVENDKELLIELIEIFLDDCPKKMGKLRKAIEDKNYEEIADVAHSLKGASGNLAAKKISALFLILEKKGKDKDLSDIDPIIQEIETLFGNVREYLEELKSGSI